MKIVIGGKPVLGPTGETPAFHSRDGEYRYYQPIAPTTLYRVKTDSLRNAAGKPVVEKYAKTFPVDGIWMDSRQKHLSEQFAGRGCVARTPDRKVETVLTDPRLQWPDTFSEGPDGSIYITASHIDESPTYNKGKSTRTTPYEAFKFKP
jgi:sugar lactone lactonase YvrE